MSKIQLEIKYEPTTVEPTELLTIKVLERSEKIFVDVLRGDDAWSSGKTAVDQKGELIDLDLKENVPNLFKLITFNEQGDRFACEPESFTIIQGSKVGSATLSYHIGVAIKDLDSGKLIFNPLKGLEKNQPTPATGTDNQLKTLKDMRPGMREDQIKVPIYEGEFNSEGTRAIYNELIYILIISADEIPGMLPEGSPVELTLKVEREKMSVSVFFPSLDFTYDITVPDENRQKNIDADWLDSEVSKAIQKLKMIREEGVYENHGNIDKQEENLTEIKSSLELRKNDEDAKKQSLNHLRKVLRELDDIEKKSEWPKVEEELKSTYYDLEEANEKFGNDKSSAIVEQLGSRLPEVIKIKDVKVAKEMIEVIRSSHYKLEDEGLGVNMEIGYLNYFNRDFDILDWKDSRKARNILDQGLKAAANNPTKNQLKPIISELYRLLPETDTPIGEGDDEYLGR